MFMISGSVRSSRSTARSRSSGLSRRAIISIGGQCKELLLLHRRRLWVKDLEFRGQAGFRGLGRQCKVGQVARVIAAEIPVTTKNKTEANQKKQ